jgi:hypothetical protein
VDADAIGTWLGIALAVAGFGVTWWQLWRTRTAAEAARAAVTATETRLATNHLLILLSQLQQIDAEMEAACASGERDAVVRALLRWTNVGSECLGILKNRNADRELRDAIREAVDLAAPARAMLTVRRRTNAASATVEVRAAMGRASNAASVLLGQLRAYTGANDE